jgi:hypothetical protein
VLEANLVGQDSLQTAAREAQNAAEANLIAPAVPGAVGHEAVGHDLVLLRSAAGNAKAAGASQGKLALLLRRAEETQAELRAPKAQIARLEAGYREAQESDEAIELVNRFLGNASSASSDQTGKSSRP